MTQKHTPGPWGYGMKDGNYVIMTADEGRLFRTVATVRDFPASSSKTEEANARLIAAAPDLLKRIEATQNFLAVLLTASYIPVEAADLIIELRNENKAAIAKATGEV